MSNKIAFSDPGNADEFPESTGFVPLTDYNRLRAQLAEAEAKALSYDLTHTGDWLERAHAIAQKNPATNAGRDVWHICVEQAEKLTDAEARLARLRPVVRAVEKWCRSGQWNDSDEAIAVLDANDDMTDSDRAWALGSEQEGRSDG